MTFERELERSLKESSKQIIPPQYLKQQVMNKIEGMEGVRKMKKGLLAAVLAAALIIPTAAIGYQAYLADDLYGSFENVKKHFAAVTIDSYMLLNAKLAQAKGELGAEEYAKFKDQLKVITSAKVEYGDQYGNIDYDTIPQEKAEQLKQSLMVVQPYFDRLNGQKSSKEILSNEEYEAYIDALMSYEKILVKSGINPSKHFDDEDILPEWLAEFQEARNIINEVNDKMIE